MDRGQINLAAALRYADAGIPVFPAKISDEENSKSWRKKPCIGNWQTQCTTDESIIRGWWEQFPDAAPAIALGSVNLVAIDVDRHGEVDGVENFAKFIDGRDLPVGPVTKTAGGGMHYIFRQPETGELLGNGTGSLPGGIDVRGNGGFIIAPGAVRSDDVAYASDEDNPDLAEAFRQKSIPPIPEFLKTAIATRRPSAATKTRNAVPPPAPTPREMAYARQALQGCARELEDASRGQRNNILNSISYRMAGMFAAGWIDQDSVAKQLFQAAKKCGLVADDGVPAIAKTFELGMARWRQEPSSSTC